MIMLPARAGYALYVLFEDVICVRWTRDMCLRHVICTLSECVMVDLLRKSAIKICYEDKIVLTVFDGNKIVVSHAPSIGYLNPDSNQ